jgi:hypothetical protein
MAEQVKLAVSVAASLNTNTKTWLLNFCTAI